MTQAVAGRAGDIGDASVMDAEVVASALNVDVETGLSAQEAASRLAQDGPNELRAAPRAPAWRRVLAQFQDPLIYLLLAEHAIEIVADRGIDAHVDDAAWAAMTAERQAGDRASMLELYRSALRIRRDHPGLGSGPMRWRDAPTGVLSIEREGGFLLVANVEGVSAELPTHRGVILASGPLDGSRLPPNMAVWLQT